ncbi:MAG TPA: hypothetical protein VLE43_17005 [Candidatus Saccharimonadia bacterium]|nr:hypothetical protein [Candidatus Saccharimonadia bacterium]
MIKLSPQAFRPVNVGHWEALLMRLFFAIAVVWCMWKELPFEKMEVPNGLARLIPLEFLGGEDAALWFRPLIIVAALLYVLEWLNPLGLVVLTLAHLGYNTLQNSQGFTYHGYNIIGLVLLAQCAAELWWRGRVVFTKASAVADRVRYGYQLYFAQCAIAAVYVTSAITKLSKSDGQWLFRSHYLAKSIVKTHRQTFYDNPEGLTVPPVSVIAEWLAEHHVITRLAFGGGFMLELFAFLALWNRAWALFIGLSIIAFHFGVELIMQLDFRVNQVMCLIFLVNVPFWAWWVAAGRKEQGTLAERRALL